MLWIDSVFAPKLYSTLCLTCADAVELESCEYK